MDIRKSLINWDKTSPQIEKMTESEKQLIATFAQGIIARGKLGDEKIDSKSRSDDPDTILRNEFIQLIMDMPSDKLRSCYNFLRSML